MSYDFRVKKEQREVTRITPKETLEDVNKYPIKGNPKRGIRQEICEKFGVRCATSESDGKSVIAYYFPSFNAKGEVIGYTKQDLTKLKEEIGHWTAVGTVRIQNKMFGQNVSEGINRKRKTLTVTEGQWDALSVYQAQIDDVKGTQYAHLEPFVVSIPMGTKNAVESMMHNKEFIKSFDELNVFFDNDECTPNELSKGWLKGKEAREAVAGAFLSDIQLTCTIAEHGLKDASDYMQKGMAKELAKLVSFDRKALVTEKVVKASAVSFEDLLTPREEGIYVHEFPDLMYKIRGFRKRELTILCSPSGVGKSTVTSIFGGSFIAQGEKVGMIYLEEEIKETVQRMIASRLKVSYLEFKANPTSVASIEDIQEAYDFIVNQDRLVLLDHFGSMPVSDLMNKIKHMYFVEGCGYIILDHLSMVISGSNVADERKELDMAMTELASFCASHDIGIIVVSHINRSNADQFKAPKGKEDESYWVRVTKESLRGSSALEQLSWIVLGLEPQIMPDRSRGNVRFTVLKNRPWGFLGEADEFSIDQNTWEVILENPPQQKYSQQPQTTPQCFIEDIQKPSVV